MKTVRVTVPRPLLVYRYGGKTKLTEEGRCRMCQRPSHVRRLTRHHLVDQHWCNRCVFLRVRPDTVEPMPRYRVRDCDMNIVPLCGPCHAEVEADVAARRMLRKLLAPQEVAFTIKLRGEQWFEQRYPRARRRLYAVA